ncbi:MAG: OsmC family protein [Oligoflexales bacterium]
MRQTIVYRGDLRVEALHVDSQNTIMTDAPKDNQGRGESFSPTDLLCTALASCMLTIAGIKARTLNIDMSGITVDLEKKMTSSPRKVGEIVLRFDWKGLDRRISSEQLETLKQAAITCPVALSLDPNVKKTMIW